MLIILFLALAHAAQPAIGSYEWESPTRTDAFGIFIGQEATLGQSHQPKENWSKIEGEGWQLAPWSKWVQQKPATRRLNLSVVPFPPDGNLWACARGEYDAHYQKLASNLIGYKLQGTIIRFGWEWSGGWFYWNTNGGKEQIFGQCFARFVKVVRAAQPSAGFKFDWNPNWDASVATLDKAWPGDDYVDYVGVDLYDANWMNHYANCPSTGCGEAEAMKSWTLQQLPALTKFKAFATKHDKPLSIPEWGLISTKPFGGGDNPTYVKNMLNWMKDPTNKVAYQSYFDVTNAAEGNLQLVDPTTAPKSAAVFAQTIRSFGTQSFTHYRPAKAALTQLQGTLAGGFTYSATSPIDETLITQVVMIDAANVSRVIARETRAFQANRAETFAVKAPVPIPGPFRIEVYLYTSTYQTRAYRNDFGAISP